jgi:arylsulfatase A-like enzyme
MRSAATRRLGLLGSLLLLANACSEAPLPQLRVVARLLPLSIVTPARDTPLAADERRAEVVTVQRRSYRSLGVPVASPSTIEWPVDLPRSSRLRFGYVVTAPGVQGPAGGRVVVSVDFRGRDGRTTRLLRTTDPVEILRWVPREIDLGFDAPLGRGDLLFTVEPAGSPAGASFRWLDPTVLAPGEEDRSSVLVICVDTLRADRLPLGGAVSAMPAMSRRLASAAAFTRAYANSSWSLPSMASILTGLLPGEHLAGRRTVGGATSERTTDWNAKPISVGIELIIGGRPHHFQILHPSVTTLAEILGEQGYETAAIHHNGYIDPLTRVTQGFDLVHHYAKADAITATDEAIGWLSERQDRDFLLFLHYIDPHQWPTRFPAELLSKPPGEVSDEEKSAIIAAYDELCAYTDAQLDRLFASLAEMGIDRRTHVILLSDHGERLFEWGRGGGSAEHGASLHESVIRVPLAFWGPGIHARTVSTRVGLIDVAPTVLDLLGISGGPRFSGRTLAPLLQGEDEPDRDVIAEYLLTGEDHSALLRGSWKYTAYPDPADDRLFDLAGEEGPEGDRRAEQAALAASLRQELMRHRHRSEAVFSKLSYDEVTMGRDTYESLKALGYLGN